MTRPGRFWTLAVVATLAGLGGGCAGTTATTTVMAPGGERSRAPLVEVLPNGFTLVVQDHRASDIVAVYLWVATGVRY